MLLLTSVLGMFCACVGLAACGQGVSSTNETQIPSGRLVVRQELRLAPMEGGVTYARVERGGEVAAYAAVLTEIPEDASQAQVLIDEVLPSGGYDVVVWQSACDLGGCPPTGTAAARRIKQGPPEGQPAVCRFRADVDSDSALEVHMTVGGGEGGCTIAGQARPNPPPSPTNA